ncbi:MAG: preprotein translocase subunit YajC [Oscillospiraceae bacterium]|nr:preprotein translocase subunit YajC [Oscillospiraceae bacterium]MDD5964916.1 preprotein translocase subunit YajC [Oscillospiraceae bacterium]MDD7538581.1 preprotein translocase subunit YajC [Oscillospiraceae bacterium]MDY5735831.1 preprotein translocase subunit YajC [Oscillospiraceae bacterium]MDY6020303.1 preprotein translocase subunit YajC [Oscillospiraceae bacterium]
MDSIMLIVIMIAVFYFMIIRPENKRKKRAEEMRNSLKKGERVTTIGGMVGRVVQVNDTTIVFETSEDRVRIEIAKWGIQSTESMEQAAAQKGRKVKKEAEAEEPAKVEQSDQPEEPVVVEAPKEKDAKDYDPEIK